MNTLQLPWGKGKIGMQLPETWHISGVLEPVSQPGVVDLAREVTSSLHDPIGKRRLSELVRPNMKIAVVIDDSSRPTPVKHIFLAVMNELQRGGVDSTQVTVIPALGLHRPMKAAELGERIGLQWMGSIKWESPDCDDKDRLVYLGITSRRTPVWINQAVAQADLVVSIGCIEPHIIASFGGGYKNLVPGVAGRETITHNHSINYTPQTFNNVGQPIERNPMRMDLEEAAGMLKPPVFIVNAILNSSLEVVRVVSGDPITAHREGVRISASIFGVHIPDLADVVITSSSPMDTNLRQGVKALANTLRSIKRGGVLITLVKADEGVGVFGLANRKLPLGKRGLKLIAPLLLPQVTRLKLQGMGEEDRFFLYFALQAMLHGTLLMYAPTIPTQTKQNLPFVTFVGSVNAAVEQARQHFPRKAQVLVLPYGGSTYPILPDWAI